MKAVPCQLSLKKKKNGSNQDRKWTGPMHSNKRTNTSQSQVWETDTWLLPSWKLHWRVHRKHQLCWQSFKPKFQTKNVKNKKQGVESTKITQRLGYIKRKENYGIGVKEWRSVVGTDSVVDKIITIQVIMQYQWNLTDHTVSHQF